MIVRYDGTFAGLLTVCGHSDLAGAGLLEIQRPPYPMTGLFDEIREIPTDDRLAAEVRARIIRELSPRAAENVRLAFLSEHPVIEMAIWRYLTLGWKLGRRLDSYLAHPDVHTVHCWAGRTAREGHRLKGLARFRETQDGTLYAALYADANVLPLLAPHFIRRLDHPWVLHDVRRELGAIGRDGRYLLGTLENPAGIAWSASENDYQELWRTFHHHIAIPDRISQRRQRQFMPLKYWQYLTEMTCAV